MPATVSFYLLKAFLIFHRYLLRLKAERNQILNLLLFRDIILLSSYFTVLSAMRLSANLSSHNGDIQTLRNVALARNGLYRFDCNHFLALIYPYCIAFYKGASKKSWKHKKKVVRFFYLVLSGYTVVITLPMLLFPVATRASNV